MEVAYCDFLSARKLKIAWSCFPDYFHTYVGKILKEDRDRLKYSLRISDKKQKNCALFIPNKFIKQEKKLFVFDVDGVIFDGKVEKLYKKLGLQAFRQAEENKKYLLGGPLLKFYAGCLSTGVFCVALTARGPENGEVLLSTFRKWNVFPRQLIMTAGQPKDIFLKALKPSVYFENDWTKAQRYSKITNVIWIPEDY